VRAALITAPGEVEVTTVDDPTPGPDALARFRAGEGRRIQVVPTR